MSKPRPDEILVEEITNSIPKRVLYPIALVAFLAFLGFGLYRCTAGPGEPLAECRDGSMTYSLGHEGACSHHGGVRRWFR